MNAIAIFRIRENSPISRIFGQFWPFLSFFYEIAPTICEGFGGVFGHFGAILPSVVVVLALLGLSCL